MKHLLVVLSLIVAVTVNAEELRSFLGIGLGENIHQDKFMSFDKALKGKGIATSEIDPSIYAMLKEMHVCRLEKAFGAYDEAFVKANPNGRICYVGILQFFKKEEIQTAQAEFHAAERSILSTYGGHGMKEITKQSNSALWSAIVNNLSSPTTEITARIFAFGNDAGDISQIISLCIVRDTATGGGLFRVVAEDVALENDVKQDSQSHRAKVNEQSADQQENNVAPEPKNNAQLARAKALLANDRAKRQAEDDLRRKARQKSFDSFCGISFGTLLMGESGRSEDGKYLCGNVKLETPFRGCDTVKVYAGVKSHRIFMIELKTCDEPSVLEEILVKRYKGNEMYRIGFWGMVMKVQLNGGNVILEKKKAVTRTGPKEFGILTARHYKYLELADREYEQESGGDGSLVL